MEIWCLNSWKKATKLWNPLLSLIWKIQLYTLSIQKVHTNYLQMMNNPDQTWLREWNDMHQPELPHAVHTGVLGYSINEPEVIKNLKITPNIHEMSLQHLLFIPAIRTGRNNLTIISYKETEPECQILL